MEHNQAEFHISTHLTSPTFHPRVFTAHCAAVLVGLSAGCEARANFEAACFDEQEDYMNLALAFKESEAEEAIAAEQQRQKGEGEQPSLSAEEHRELQLQQLQQREAEEAVAAQA